VFVFVLPSRLASVSFCTLVRPQHGILGECKGQHRCRIGSGMLYEEYQVHLAACRLPVFHSLNTLTRHAQEAPPYYSTSICWLDNEGRPASCICIDQFVRLPMTATKLSMFARNCTE
jgi:hypothetical protein